MAHPQLHLVCQDPKVDIKVDLGDGPPTPTEGASSAEVIDRTSDKSLTAFGSLPPFQQDVPILLDGYRKNNPVQRQHDLILSLGGETVFRAHGPIFRPGRRYLFGSEPEYGEMLRADDGALLRCRMTLKLMEFVPADQAGKRRRPKIGLDRTNVAVGGTYTVRKGDTLSKIAARILNNHRRWEELGRKNGIGDPNKKLEPGRVLRV